MTNPVKILLAIVLFFVALALFFRWRIALEPMMRVTSWWRSEYHNKAVGGVPSSRHLLGLAFDVTPVNDIVGARLRKMGFRKVLNEGDHFHVEIV